MRFHHEEVLNNKNLTVSEKVHIVDIDLIRRTNDGFLFLACFSC